jgi:hypothetical protein
VLQKRGVKNTVKVVMPRQNSEPSRILVVTLPLSSVVGRSVRLRRTEYRTVWIRKSFRETLNYCCWSNTIVYYPFCSLLHGLTSRRVSTFLSKTQTEESSVAITAMQGSSPTSEDVGASAIVLLELGKDPTVTPKKISKVKDQIHLKRTYDHMQTPYESPQHAYRASADTENFANGSNDATEPKILFSGEILYALHSGEAVSPQRFGQYDGAPCPICYGDLGAYVPKDTNFGIAFKTFKGNSKEHNSHLKTLGETCRKHSSNVHNGLPIWCVYRKQDLDKTKSRLPTKEATVSGLLHYALKAGCESVPFEFFCPPEMDITPAKIQKICLTRFSFAIASLALGCGNYLRERKSRIPKKVIKEEALAIVHHFMHEFDEFGWAEEMDFMIQKFSRNQILGVCNLFFVEYNFYKFCPKWFYIHMPSDSDR